MKDQVLNENNRNKNNLKQKNKKFRIKPKTFKRSNTKGNLI